MNGVDIQDNMLLRCLRKFGGITKS